MEKIELLNEFLVHLALFRVFSQGNNIFILPASCDLYIELGNTLDNFLENRIFYRLYVESRQLELKSFNIDEFDINNDLINDSQIRMEDIQYICNHMNHYRKSFGNPALASKEIIF